VSGRFEWGARALGHRSLLADPRKREIGERVNATVKHREPFRAHEIAVLAERAGELLEVPAAAAGPTRFMLSDLPLTGAGRESLGAALLTDGTVQAQLVDAPTDPRFHELLRRFGEETGVPALLNVPLNLRGDAMARGERDAYDVFERTDLDCLFVENRFYSRG
jgi:carbamoyltransferase